MEEIEKMFKAKVHLGHQRSRLHPKAKKYVYKIVNGTAIIDLSQTVVLFNQAKDFLKQASKENKTLLVVSTKKIVNQMVTELLKDTNIPYITVKWLPGLLTNFDMIMKNVKKLQKMEEDKKNGLWDKFVKHELTKLDKQLNKLKHFYGGISKLTKKPDLMLIVDIKKEKNALLEAKAGNIPVVAILDTNCNPDVVNYPIVANDDSASSLEYLIKELVDVYIKGSKK